MGGGERDSKYGRRDGLFKTWGEKKEGIVSLQVKRGKVPSINNDLEPESLTTKDLPTY